MDSILKYHQLRGEIDNRVDELWEDHHKNMACKKGCDLCCLNFDVFPVEFDAIKKQVKEEYSDILLQEVPADTGEKCIFIVDHQCSIYNARPIICRTHGFPLLNMNEAGDQWELSACELNFTDVDDDYFNEENTYPQDTINSQLFMLNKEHIKVAHPEKGEFELIPLSRLFEK